MRCKSVRSGSASDKDRPMRPNWLNVERATTFFKSLSTRASSPAKIRVKIAKWKREDKGVDPE